MKMALKVRNREAIQPPPRSTTTPTIATATATSTTSGHRVQQQSRGRQMWKCHTSSTAARAIRPLTAHPLMYPASCDHLRHDPHPVCLPQIASDVT
jgi:hypothetical protein